MQPITRIELRVDDVSQLFDTLDPFPFRERDLDKEAEEYIVGWARELPRDQQIEIVVHLPSSKATEATRAELQEAMARYFGYCVTTVTRDLRELLRIGRRSLGIGIATLVVVIVGGQILVGLPLPEPAGRLAEESSLILGWVANWRPLEIFLYDWWPLVRRRHLYRRLATSAVAVRPV